MSCYIVGHATIDALMTYAKTESLSYWARENWHQVTAHNAEEIGRILLDENVRSVCHRYQEDRSQHVGASDEAAAYRYRIMVTPITHMEAMKLADCVAYQSNETDDWKETVAHAVLHSIVEHARRKLPGYDKAPWGINDHNDKNLEHAGAISLSLMMQRQNQDKRTKPR